MRRLSHLFFGASLASVTAPIAAGAQIPVPTKVLQVEAAPQSIDSGYKAFVAGDESSGAAQNVSNDCRKQFSDAKAKNPNLVSFGCVFRRLKLNTSAKATEYFGGFDVGNAIALTYNQKKSTLYTDLLSDNLWLSAALGYARVGISAQVSDVGNAEAEGAAGQEGEERRESAVDQLFQGGGNAILHASIPLSVWINFVGETDIDRTPVRTFDSFLTLSTGLDVPELNGTLDSRSGYGRLGLQSMFAWRTFNNDFRFFAQGAAAYVVGFNGGFYTNLAGEDAIRPAAGLGLVRGTLGVEIAKIARVGASFGTTTLSGVNQPARLTIQLVNGK